MTADYRDFIQEPKSIGMKNERSLHSQIKEWYFKDGDKLEVPVDSYIIDIVRNDLLIEIQTKNLAAIKSKLKNLLNNHQVRVIYPIAAAKHIKKILPAKDGLTNSSIRKSPKKGSLLDVFKELVMVTDIMTHPNFQLQVLFIEEEEIRTSDGKGSWRRKGVSITDRRLNKVINSIFFNTIEDYLSILPRNLPTSFTTRDLSYRLNTTMNISQKIVYCLKKTDVIKQIGKKGNLLIYTLNK